MADLAPFPFACVASLTTYVGEGEILAVHCELRLGIVGFFNEISSIGSL